MNDRKPRYHSEKQVARMYDVHPDTVRSWRKKGLIGFRQSPTGRIAYTAQHLADFEARFREVDAALENDQLPASARTNR
ncbi:MerR family transcriptional regulator [Citromicrobium bathyomarinum]